MGSATAVKSISADLAEEKPTKNTVRFAEAEAADGSEPLVNTIYVPNATLAALGNPKAIRVTIEAL